MTETLESLSKLDQAIGAAQKIAEAQPPESLVLPTLQSIEPQKTLMQQLIEALTQLVEKFLRAILPDMAPSSPIDLQAIAKGVTWLAAIVITIAVLLLIYELTKYFSTHGNRTRESAPSPSAPTENQLLALLAAALAEKSYARAARLRWRVCLQRLGEPQSLTPRELALRRQLAAPLEPTAYGLMFRAQAPDASAFEAWEKTLRGLEPEGA